MLPVHAGTFLMSGGSADPDDLYKDHQVTLTHDFFLSESEITRAQWAANPANVAWTYYSNDCSGTDCPGDSISWYDAAMYSNWVSEQEGLPDCYRADGHDLAPDFVSDPFACPGYRLPTEAEWEYAARANADTEYSGGNNLALVAWFNGTTIRSDAGTSHPVCQLLKNAWGFCDMSGNEWEWTDDRYDEFYGGYGDGAAAVDPIGSTDATATARAARGGSWFNGPKYMTPAFRGNVPPGFVDISMGFRIARSAN